MHPLWQLLCKMSNFNCLHKACVSLHAISDWSNLLKNHPEFLLLLLYMCHRGINYPWGWHRRAAWRWIMVDPCHNGTMQLRANCLHFVVARQFHAKPFACALCTTTHSVVASNISRWKGEAPLWWPMRWVSRVQTSGSWQKLLPAHVSWHISNICTKFWLDLAPYVG